MLVFSIILFCTVFYFFVSWMYRLIQALIHMNEAPMVDNHNAQQTAEEMHRRLRRRYFGTTFVHGGDHEYKFQSWSRRLMKKDKSDAFIGLVSLCHKYGCEIIIEDDIEPSGEKLTDLEREQGIDFHSNIPAMSHSDYEFCIMKK